MTPVLEFERTSKRYRRGWRGDTIAALDDFSLTVERGEVFGFLGPNGAGKTTAIHIAMGFTRATAGGGQMLGRPFGDAATRARVGFLAENVAFYHRPAARLVRFYGALNGLAGGRLRERTRYALDAVDLWSDADRNISKFSRGMLQRVGLAQALVNDPELLVLDEPTSALDPLARVAIRELLRHARDRGKTVFLSSHLLSEIELICDRVGIVHRGRLVRVGTTSELLETRAETEIVARGAGRARVDAGDLARVGGGAGEVARVHTSPLDVRTDGLVRIVVPTAEQRATIEKLWAQGAEIVSVNPVRKSLEELFVELTGEGNAPASGGRA